MAYSQKEQNQKRINAFKRNGIEHSYSQDEFRPWSDKGNYIKSYYDVKFPGGAVLKHQWPNAGTIGGFTEADGVLVKLSDTHITQKDLEDKQLIADQLNSFGAGNLIQANQQGHKQLEDRLGIVVKENEELKSILRQVVKDLENRAIAASDIDDDGTVCLDLSNGLLLRIETILARDNESNPQVQIRNIVLKNGSLC